MLDPMLLRLFEADVPEHDTSQASGVAFLVDTLARVERERRRLKRVKYAIGFATALVLALALTLASQLLARGGALQGRLVHDAASLAAAIESAAHALGALLATPPLWACAVVLLLAAQALVRFRHAGWR